MHAAVIMRKFAILRWNQGSRMCQKPSVDHESVFCKGIILQYCVLFSCGEDRCSCNGKENGRMKQVHKNAHKD